MGDKNQVSVLLLYKHKKGEIRASVEETAISTTYRMAPLVTTRIKGSLFSLGFFLNKKSLP